MSEEAPALFEIMQTTRSMRRLKPDPVPAALIRKILEAGTSAPSGGNMQRWRFLVVRDPEIKKTGGPTTNELGTKWLARDTGRAIPLQAPAQSALRVCSTPPNIWQTTSTRLRCGSSPVCREQTLPARRDRQSIRQFRTCFWRQERSA